MPVPAATDYQAVFRAEERFLWGLCYRLTGSAADADDLVQETFVRAIERPPARTDVPWRPWLVRVALNLGRDLLRRRRRARYDGPWLPAPIDTGADASPPAYEPEVAGLGTTEGRYDLLESVTFAFLLALEALTPTQRAVLLLRDVFDYSAAQVADALDLSVANVRTSHHRARRAMAAYDRDRCRPTRALQAETRAALDRLIACLATQDMAGMEALLTADVRALSDGGGEFHAARKPLLGVRRVATFYTRLAARRPAVALDVRMLNGLPAVVMRFAGGLAREAERVVLRVDVGADGRIRAIDTVLATRKLAGLRA